MQDFFASRVWPMADTVSARPLRVLMVHNAYQQWGGEDAVVEAETALLRQHGHTVLEYRRHNDEIKGQPAWRTAATTLWSRRTADEVARELSGADVDIVHCHNTFPLVSPSVYWAAHRAGVPVVQTLHNFRLLCPQAMLLRDGRVCEDCVGHLPWRAAVHACYRGSRTQSSVLAGMLSIHRALGTYKNKVAVYIALSEFGRRKFIEGGLPAERIRVKPNFVDLPAEPPTGPRNGFLFVGRLSPEKGVSVLAAASQRLEGIDVRVAGTGPAKALLAASPGVALLGALPVERVLQEMQRARALVLPSVWYEGFPRTLVEAFACGLPVIASRIGTLTELVEHGVTGLLVAPGDAADLAQAMMWAAQHPAQMAAMGARARAAYRDRLDAGSNYGQLLAIYAQALAREARSAA